MIAFLQFLIFLTFMGIWWHLRDKAKYSKYPPGPPRLPFIGNLLQLLNADEFPSISLSKLSKKYGPVLHVKMGLVDAVVFNSHEVVSEILNHDKATGKKYDLIGTIKIRNQNQNLGITFANGDLWQTLRRFTVRTLRDFGFGKAASMDAVIDEEYGKFSAHLKREMGPDGVIQAEEMFELPIVNVLWRLVTGVNYSYDDPKIVKLFRISDIMMKSTNFAFDSTVAFPFLFDMFPGWSGKIKQIEVNKDLKDFARDTIAEHKSKGKYMDSPECYVDVFLRKMEETRDDPGSYFTQDNFVLCLIDLFQAGSETSSKSLTFSIIYMVLHPQVQEKIQAEIDRQVGASESIAFSTRSKLPYAYATYLESLRMASVVPFPPPRMAIEDFTFRDYFIKGGTPLLVNQQAAHFDTDKWIDPFNFRPDRFLNKEGDDVDSKMASSLVAFGGGKRVCLGQSMAESSVFTYFASLLRDFKIQKAPGEPAPDPVPKPGLTYSARPFKVQLVPRKRTHV